MDVSGTEHTESAAYHASDPGHPLQLSGSLLKGWACFAGAQVLGANAAELLPRIKKFLIKSEIPQYMPQ